MLAAVLAVIALGVFHRTLILWALNRLGPQGAARAGLDLKWQVDGSLWSDLSVGALEAIGRDSSLPLTRLTVGKAAVKYDLAAAWRGDYLKVATGLTLHDVTAVIDLRHPAKPTATARPAQPGDKQKMQDLLRSLVWPDLDLQNLNVTVLLPGSETLTISGVDLILPAGRPGTLRVKSVQHPQLARYPVRDVTAVLRVAGTRIDIENLALPPQITLPHLGVDASDYGQGKVAAQAQIRSGAATVDLKARADLGGAQPLIDAVLDIAGIDEQEVGRWLKDAPPAKGRLHKLHVEARGDPLLPRQLDAKVTLDLRDAAWQGYRSESVTLEAVLAGGRLSVSPCQITAGGNQLSITTQAEAPAGWADFAHTPLELQWQLRAPTLQGIAGLPVKLGGSVNGGGLVKLAEQGLQQFTATVSGSALAVNEHRVRTLELTASGDLKAITFKTEAQAEAGDGRLDASGTVGLAPGTASAVKWNLALPAPDALARSLKLPWPADVTMGAVSAGGDLAFDLAAVKGSKFDGVKGGGQLAVKDIAWRKAPCEQVTAQWSLDKGRATLAALEVRLTGANTVRAAGSLALGGDQSFDGTLTLALADLSALQPWHDAALKPADGAPTQQLRGGAIHLDWKGNGRLKDALKVDGAAVMKIEQVRYDAVPEPVSLDSTLTHDLASATFQSLRARLGPWSAAFNGTAGTTGVKLADLEVSHGSVKLLTGSVEVPLDLQAQPVPVDAQRPLHVHLSTPGRHTLATLAGVAGKPLPPGLEGVAEASVQLDGLLPELQARVELKAGELKLPQVPSTEPGQVAFLLTLQKGELTVDSTAAVKPLEPLAIHAQAQVDVTALLKEPGLAMETPFEASVKLNQPTLDFVQPLVPALAELKGSLRVDGRASGTARAPRLTGTLALDVPVLALRNTDLPLIKDLRARVSADGTLVRLESLHAVTAGGEVEVAGTCDVTDLKKPGFDVTLKAGDLLVMRNDMLSLRTDAALRCQGTPTAARLSGTVDLTRGRVFQEVNFLPLSKMMNDLPPLPDATVARPAAAASTDAAASSPGAVPLPPMLKDWTFDVNVKTKDSIRLLGNVLNGGVKIDLRAGGSGAAPEVTGLVQLEEARLNLPFSTLRVKTGNVTFEKERPLEPSLELVAESTVDIYDIVLRGYGSALSPKVRFTSTPPLPEGEIATLLATGSTTTGLTKAGDQAAGRLLVYAVREAYRRAFQSKTRAPAKDEKNSEARFTVQERTEDGRLGGVTGTYEFSRKMKIVGSTDKEGGFRAMLHYLFRFD